MQRICGVCPVPHGMTATYAADTVLGYSNGHITFKGGVSEKAMLIRNLVLAAEFLMSSITHFYHLVAPSYVQGPAIPPWTPYFNNSYYNPLLRESAAGRGAANGSGGNVSRSGRQSTAPCSCGTRSSSATSRRSRCAASPSRPVRCSPDVCR